ncbi:methyltransferase family protein [Aurantiacibacter gilvus]|uniref:Isoprenylcysteine carboxylmethyltransferase family protein n=1 Tax=Aurantiacibacter gilvus TaxID=3139141 RepID=A0ABU9IHM8_9SPHN
MADKQHPFELAIPPAVLLIAGFALIWAAERFLPAAALTFPAQKWLAVGLVVAGVGVILAGILTFRRHQTSVDPRDPGVASTLVDGGIFALTRNPMYLGMTLILAGSALGHGNWVALVVPVLFALWIDRFQIVPEERSLGAAFPEAFAAYREKTRRWL